MQGGKKFDTQISLLLNFYFILGIQGTWSWIHNFARLENFNRRLQDVWIFADKHTNLCPKDRRTSSCPRSVEMNLVKTKYNQTRGCIFSQARNELGVSLFLARNEFHSVFPLTSCLAGNKFVPKLTKNTDSVSNDHPWDPKITKIEFTM